MVGTIIGETKKEGQKTHNPHEPKKQEKASPFHGRKLSLTYIPSNVVCIQISLEQTLVANTIFLFIVEAKAC